MKIYYDQDADLSLLANKTVAVIGYGSQGHAAQFRGNILEGRHLVVVADGLEVDAAGGELALVPHAFRAASSG